MDFSLGINTRMTVRINAVSNQYAEPPGHNILDNRVLETAMAVYLNVWNMQCPDCANWVKDCLLQIDGIFIVDVFHAQGIAVVIYDPALVVMHELLAAFGQIGTHKSHSYGAEIIGQCSAKEALHL